MSDINGSNVPAGSRLEAETAPPASSTRVTCAAPINHRRTRELPREPLIAPSTSPQEPPSAVEVIDDTLEDDDLRVSIVVTVHGRSRKFANLKFDKTVYGGTRDYKRGLFFMQLEQLLQDILQGVGIKVNSKLDGGVKSGDVQHNGNGGKAHLVTEKLPLVDEQMSKELEDMLRIHVPPPLDAH